MVPLSFETRIRRLRSQTSPIGVMGRLGAFAPPRRGPAWRNRRIRNLGGSSPVGRTIGWVSAWANHTSPRPEGPDRHRDRRLAIWRPPWALRPGSPRRGTRLPATSAPPRPPPARSGYSPARHDPLPHRSTAPAPSAARARAPAPRPGASASAAGQRSLRAQAASAGRRGRLARRVGGGRRQPVEGPVDRGGGEPGLPLHEQRGELRRGRRPQALAATLGPLGSAAHEEGHVRPHPRRHGLQAVVPEAEPVQAVHGDQRRRRVAGSPSQPGLRRDALVDPHLHRKRAAGLGLQRVQRPSRPGWPAPRCPGSARGAPRRARPRGASASPSSAIIRLVTG